MDVQNRVINPANLKAIGFIEYSEDGMEKYKRGNDIMWFTGRYTFSGELTKELTFSDIAQEIIVKVKIKK